jgi:Na+/phosphate symporter
MSATVVILELAGNIILLLWGMRMVHGGFSGEHCAIG